MIENICPICGHKDELERITKEECFEIKDREIRINVDYFKCNECGGEFVNTKENADSLNLAFDKYREFMGMVKPGAIKEFRARYNLTQRELSNLLGWGGATLSRYENGALQDEAHDKMLKLIMDPRNLKKLITENTYFLTKEKRNSIIKSIDNEINLERNIINDINSAFFNYDKDIFTGFKKFDIDKAVMAIKYFCFDEYVFKTKLNKLLFYFDFKVFKDSSVSGTGLQYAHIPYGPSPHNFDTLFTWISLGNYGVKFEEEILSNCSGEIVVCKDEPNPLIFSPKEYEILVFVKDYFRKFNSKAIAEYSHKEVAYKNTKNGKLISYKYAEELSI